MKIATTENNIIKITGLEAAIILETPRGRRFAIAFRGEELEIGIALKSGEFLWFETKGNNIEVVDN